MGTARQILKRKTTIRRKASGKARKVRRRKSKN
jgi:hypothetical protein